MTRANVLLIYADHFPGPLMGIAGHERIPYAHTEPAGGQRRPLHPGVHGHADLHPGAARSHDGDHGKDARRPRL